MNAILGLDFSADAPEVSDQTLTLALTLSLTLALALALTLTLALSLTLTRYPNRAEYRWWHLSASAATAGA